MKTNLIAVSSCTTAYEIWHTLEITFEGTSSVKQSRLNIATHKYELFKMLPNESITEMYTRFTIIVNNLKSLGEKITNEKMVKKILWSLTKDWKTKTTTIEEAKDLSTLTIDDLIGSLLGYELQVKEEEEEEEKPKRKQISLKAEKKCDR